MHTDDIPVPQQVWEDTASSSRSVSEGSLNASSEQLALSGFAFQLTSIIGSDESSIADEVDVQEEAKLLMSLSCATPSTNNITTNSSSIHKTNATTHTTSTSTTSTTTSTGRITPFSSDSSSCYSSTSSKRDSFCFTCPSLSLENHSRDVVETTSSEQQPPQPQQQRERKHQHEESSSSSSSQSSLPSVLLGRSLKIDDKDALRLSSEAMGRNILQSYKKALDWRLKSWEHSLSRVLVRKERDLVASNASEEAVKALLTSGEANLLLALRAMKTKLRVMDATTSFKVLPQRLNKTSSEHPPPSKKQRLEELGSGLEETEYEYQVAHAMTLEGCLNIHTPAGYCKIELEVPGSMTGTFLSPVSDGAGEELTDVRMDVNTDILAAMIEKSSRTVLRAATAALLKGEVDVEQEHPKEEATAAEEQTVKTNPKGRKVKSDVVNTTKVETPQPVTATSTPKRKLSEERMSTMVVITPARNVASSPSSFGDSDYEDKPVLLSLPDSFPSGNESKPSLRMLTPKPSRKKAKKSTSLPTVVTPHKTQRREAITSGAGPTLPLLVEVACAMVQK